MTTINLLPPLLLSLRVALLATVVVALLGVPLAFLMARWRFPGKSLLEALFTLPLVLPPTVVGYAILLVLGRRGLVIGPWLDRTFDYSIMFHWHGAVVAAVVVAFPLLYLPARNGFAAVEREMEDVARLEGASLVSVFWHVSLPMARRAIGAGLLLTFSRALGEFGATIMVLGDVERYQTLPIVIYQQHLSIDGQHTVIMASLLLALVSLVVMLLYNNRSSLGKRD